MARFVLDLTYKGTGYSGWERQANTPKTLQAEVEAALTRVLREPTSCYSAGRTDAGVHATLMPAHFDFKGEELHPAFLIAMNAVLSDAISVDRVWRAARENFHARFSAIWRSYEYRIIFRKSPILHNLTFSCRKILDFDLLQKAAAIILEFDDFESFCKSGATAKTFICHMKYSYWEWQGDMLVYKVMANRFLRGMVRSLVGTMILVATGQISLERFREVIASKNRNNAGMAVFAGGLFLTGVGYREGELIPYSDAIRQPM